MDGGPAPHLDCRPVAEEEREGVADLLGAAWLEEPLEERARTLAVTDLVPRHLREVRDRRLPELDKIESAVKERMRREITHLQHRALELEAEERAGRRPRLNSKNVLRQSEAMTDRLALRLADIESRDPATGSLRFIEVKGRRADARTVAELTAFAECGGFEVLGIFKETASGTRNNRLVRNRVLELAQARRIDAVLVTELSGGDVRRRTFSIRSTSSPAGRSPWPLRTTRWRPSGSCSWTNADRYSSNSAETAASTSRCAPVRRSSVKGSETRAGAASETTVSLVMCGVRLLPKP